MSAGRARGEPERRRGPRSALAIACVAAQLVVAEAAAEASPGEWPLLRAYAEHFIAEDGRVIDWTGGEVTTSEGQSYALFFALVDGDRALFDRLLRWTQDNLARGDLAANLPSTRWGRRPDGGFGVLDPNSAADSDLWIGYVLVEAGRLWEDARLGALGRRVLENVVRREVVQLPGLGAMLLPAPYGFVLDRRTWRLNASYLPPSLLAGLRAEQVPGPWRELKRNAVRLIEARAKHGFVDDWTAYVRGRGFVTDPVAGDVGSYDAIRVYLWAGLLGDGDADKARLARALSGPWRWYRKHEEVPERVATQRPPRSVRSGPVGFQGALLPRAFVEDRAVAVAIDERIEAARRGALYGEPPTYYDHNLLLFARGFVERRYRFAVDGRLRVRWSPEAGEPGARREDARSP